MTLLKQALGLGGIGVALLGIALDSGAVIWVAIGLLAGSVLIRLVLSLWARRREAISPDA